MKKTILFLLLSIVSSVRFAYGDEIKSIKLDNNGHDKEVIQLSFCNIFVELQQGNEEDQYRIFVKLENVSEDKILYLFDKPYNEKTLKKTCNIVYDKLFPGAKGKRIAEACEGLSESCQLLPSSESNNIFNFQKKESPIKCRLPIYIARTNEKNFIVVKKSKILLAQKEVIELNIDVQLKPDEDLIRLSEATDSLIEEIGRQTFCSNKNHRGSSLEDMYRIYNKSIEDLKMQVRQVLNARINTRNYMSSDKGYQHFAAILEKLDSVKLENLTVTSCNNDKKAHACKYCSLSIEEIYKRLETYYIDLHNGKKTKEQIKRDVDALYNCAQKNRKRATGSYMSRISTYYNRIKSK